MSDTVYDLIARAAPQPFNGRADWARYVYRLIMANGQTPVQASYDEVTGNCAICGQCACCPGWHMAEEMATR